MQMEELKYRKRVLRRLEFTSNADVIEIKGRVACEISSGDELLLTELIFNGVFNDLTVEQSVALLSCFVFEEKVKFSFIFFYFFFSKNNHGIYFQIDQQVKLKEELGGPLRVMQVLFFFPHFYLFVNSLKYLTKRKLPEELLEFQKKVNL